MSTINILNPFIGRKAPYYDTENPDWTPTKNIIDVYRPCDHSGESPLSDLVSQSNRREENFCPEHSMNGNEILKSFFIVCEVVNVKYVWSISS